MFLHRVAAGIENIPLYCLTIINCSGEPFPGFLRSEKRGSVVSVWSCCLLVAAKVSTITECFNIG